MHLPVTPWVVCFWRAVCLPALLTACMCAPKCFSAFPRVFMSVYLSH